MASLFDGGDLTFSLDVGGDGAASLRSTIMKKLSEFMGSYTDDVLAVSRERERGLCQLYCVETMSTLALYADRRYSLEKLYNKDVQKVERERGREVERCQLSV